MATLTRSFGKLLLAALAIFWSGQSAAIAAPSSAELAVKATYLVKFISYVTWPDNALQPGEPVSICVIGRDPFGTILDRAAAGQKSNGHLLIVRRVPASQAGTCHFAFLGGSGREVAAAKSAIGTRPVVTVSDARSSNISGIIHFQLVAGRVRFDIDAVAASRASLGVSSQLFGLARKVNRGRE